MHPVAYSLLTGKEEDTYFRLLTHFKELCPGISPRGWVTDFEAAQRNAVFRVFGISATGCLFHFSQCVYRRVQAEGLKSQYAEADGELSVWVRCLSALAFVPIRQVYDTFHALVRLPHFPRLELRPVLEYFEAQWVGKYQFGEWVDAAFPPREWNIRDRALQGLERTNNKMEGWHRRLKGMLGVHSHVFKFLQSLQMEAEDQQRQLQAFLVHGRQAPRRPEYVRSDAAITDLLPTWRGPDGDLHSYLRSLARHIHH